MSSTSSSGGGGGNVSGTSFTFDRVFWSMQAGSAGRQCQGSLGRSPAPYSSQNCVFEGAVSVTGVRACVSLMVIESMTAARAAQWPFFFPRGCATPPSRSHTLAGSASPKVCNSNKRYNWKFGQNNRDMRIRSSREWWQKWGALNERGTPHLPVISVTPRVVAVLLFRYRRCTAFHSFFTSIAAFPFTQLS